MPGCRVDIVGLGVSTIDELILLEHLPRSNYKQEVLSRKRQCGGLTGSALVAAARQGCSCAHVISLGNGELSRFLREGLGREGIRMFEDDSDPEAEPYYSLILTERDGGERSILWDNSKAKPPAVSSWLKEILAAKCLFVDHVYAEAILEIVDEARTAGIDVVGDFERTAPGSAALMDLTNHVILPLGFCRQIFGDDVHAEDVVRRLANDPGRSLACVTDGVNGAWYALGEAPNDVMHQAIFPMDNVVDTTGCGDVFHGVYCAGLVGGLPPSERIRRASAAAALKACVPGAQAGAPTHGELDSFLSIR